MSALRLVSRGFDPRLGHSVFRVGLGGVTSLNDSMTTGCGTTAAGTLITYPRCTIHYLAVNFVLLASVGFALPYYQSSHVKQDAHFDTVSSV